jgi:transposase-like protein
MNAKIKSKCVKCSKVKIGKYYIIADDLEKPRFYCTKCHKELQLEILLAMRRDF